MRSFLFVCLFVYQKKYIYIQIMDLLSHIWVTLIDRLDFWCLSPAVVLSNSPHLALVAVVVYRRRRSSPSCLCRRRLSPCCSLDWNLSRPTIEVRPCRSGNRWCRRMRKWLPICWIRHSILLLSVFCLFKIYQYKKKICFFELKNCLKNLNILYPRLCDRWSTGLLFRVLWRTCSILRSERWQTIIFSFEKKILNFFLFEENFS